MTQIDLSVIQLKGCKKQRSAPAHHDRTWQIPVVEVEAWQPRKDKRRTE